MAKTSLNCLPTNEWLSIGMDSWMLGAEAASVIVLRSAKLARGGAPAWEETKRMIAEKPKAHCALGKAVIDGRMGSTPESLISGAINHYRRRIQANQRRLAKG